MNIKKHLIIANVLQTLYLVVILLGIMLDFFDTEKIIFFSMFWYMFIIPVYTINFMLYRKAIHFYQGMNKKIFANFDKQWTKRFALMVSELFIIPAIVIINMKEAYAYIMLLLVFIVELYILFNSIMMKNIVNKKFIKLNEFNAEEATLIIKNLELIDIINKYNKNIINKTELLKKLNLILERIYIIIVLDIIDNSLYEYKYRDRNCFATFEIAEFYFKNTEIDQAAKLCKLSKIIEECIDYDKKLRIYYSEKKFLKLTKDELIKLINK